MGKGRHKRKKNKEKAEKMKNGHRSASACKVMPQAAQVGKSNAVMESALQTLRDLGQSAVDAGAKNVTVTLKPDEIEVGFDME